MSLTERSRTALYRGLVRAVEDEEAVGEMLAHFPARDADEHAHRPGDRRPLGPRRLSSLAWRPS